MSHDYSPEPMVTGKGFVTADTTAARFKVDLTPR